MFRHYLTVALRHLWRNRFHTAINVTGLAIGISGCLVIFLIVNHEFSYDRFRQDRDRIYRVHSEFTGVFEARNPGVPTGLPAALREGMPGVSEQVHFFSFSAPVSTGQPVEGPLEIQRDIALVPPAYFEMFPDFIWLAGSPEVLASPHQLVLTEAKARQYFGVKEPREALGRQLRYQDSLVVTVAGILATPDRPTDLDFGDYLSYATIRQSWLRDRFDLNNWDSTNSDSQFFVKLAPEASPADVEVRLEAIRTAHTEADDDWGVTYYLQPFSDLHFNPDLGIFNHSGPPAHRPTLLALILVAVLLLLIAAVNFINLETAQSTRRAREVGVRKVLGSSPANLLRQFLGQTWLVTATSTVIAVLLAEWTLNYFDEFIPGGVRLDLTAPSVLLFLLSIIFLTGLLAGAYPAFVLSRFRPALALKDKVSLGRQGARADGLRRGLIVFQFAFAQVLIFGTLVLGRQIDFALAKDMGFRKDEIIYFYTPWDDPGDRRFTLREELTRLPAVERISLHHSPPARRSYNTSVLGYGTGTGDTLQINAHRKFADTAFVSLYDLALVAGRNLLPGDTVREFLINETFARKIGFEQPGEAVGQYLDWGGQPIPIVGIVGDFHLQSLHHAIEPVFIGSDRDDYRCISLQLDLAGRSAGRLEGTLEEIRALWRQFYPQEKFEYHFFDESVARFYQAEQRTAKLLRTATGIAIFVSCLGLLGLVSLMANQRTKEIGIRKVLGAGVAQIVFLLSKDFLRLVGIAAALAIPLAWYLADRWLADFAYRIELEWWMATLVVLAALAVAALTVAFRSVRAARANPVEALRSE